MRISQEKRSLKKSTVVIAVLALCMMALPLACGTSGGEADSFSAEIVEIDSNGKVVNTSKIYMTPEAMRMDGIPGGGGQGMPEMNLSLLALKNQDQQYFYNHDKKLVFVSPIDEEMTKAGYEAMDNIESEKVLGEEKVSGYKCTKKEVVTSMAVMGQTIKNKLIVWENDKFDMPLRTQDDDGAIQELRNIKDGKPSEKIFRPMDGYKTVDNMMAVMGMDFRAMMARDDAEEQEEKESAGEDEQEVDAEALMAHLNQSIGKNMKPEEKEQMMSMMAQVMGQVGQKNLGQGASKDLWEIIPKHGNDKVGYEMKVGSTLDVVLGTNSTLQQIFDFYGAELKANGWTNRSTHIADGQGMMSLQKDGQLIAFAWADKPTDIKGDFKLYYNVHYTGAY